MVSIFKISLVGIWIVIVANLSFAVPLTDDVDTENANPAPTRDPLDFQLSTICPEGYAFDDIYTSSCHKVLEKGPCGELQTFYRFSKDSQYGRCACLSNSDGCNQNFKSNRMLLSAPDRKRCYWAFTQGPCQPKEWYVLNLKSREPECRKNPCCGNKIKMDSKIVKNPASENDAFTFSKNGTCYKTFTRGFCSEGEYVQYHGTTDPRPNCYSVKQGLPQCEISILGIGPVVGMPCEPGYRLVGDDCVLANVDFE